jgi:hypothetical protein
MGLSFTIGGKTFGALSSSNGAYALSEVTASGIYDIIRYHVKGIDGSYLTRGGLKGYKVMVRMRYISTTPYADMTTDQGNWENAAVSIVAQNGHTYSRCTLDPGAMRVIRQATAMGRGSAGQQFLDVEATFTSDALRQ